MDYSSFIKNGSLKIIVRPNSPKTEISGFLGDSLKLDVHAIPEKNKANIEIIKFFHKMLKKDVKIISGITSKRKVLRIH